MVFPGHNHLLFIGYGALEIANLLKKYIHVYVFLRESTPIHSYVARRIEIVYNTLILCILMDFPYR